jgi:uncharacterized integral membrane protein
MWLVPFASNPRVAYSWIAGLIALLLAVCFVLDETSPSELGLRVDNFTSVLKRIALPLGLFILALVIAGAALGSLRLKARFFSMLVVVPPWALLQQYMLLGFANRRFRLILGQGGPSILATAALFSLLHLPNPALTLACAFGGYIWAREYERAPNLLANCLTHGVASAFLANSLPTWALKNMVVGYNYFLR